MFASRILGVLLAAVTVPFTVGCVTAGVIWLDGGTETMQQTRFVEVSGSPRVSVNLVAGTLTVRQGQAGLVTLTEKDTVRGVLRQTVDSSLRRLRTSISAGAGGVTVTVPGEAPTVQGLALAGAISQHRDLTLTVPPDSPVRVSSGPGIITLSGLTGPVDLSGSTGVIRLENVTVAGSDRVRLSNGGITGSASMAGGSLDASLISGVIQLRLEDAGGAHLQASTANGSLDIASNYGVQRQKLGSAYSAEGVVAGYGGGGEITIGVTNGLIRLN